MARNISLKGMKTTVPYAWETTENGTSLFEVWVYSNVSLNKKASPSRLVVHFTIRNFQAPKMVKEIENAQQRHRMPMQRRVAGRTQAQTYRDRKYTPAHKKHPLCGMVTHSDDSPPENGCKETCDVKKGIYCIPPHWETSETQKDRMDEGLTRASPG